MLERALRPFERKALHTDPRTKEVSTYIEYRGLETEPMEVTDLPNHIVEAVSKAYPVPPSLRGVLSVIAFEKELHQRLSSTALRRWIASPDGLRHCADLDLDPREGMRLTGYNVGEVERVSRADEIYIFKPRLDGWRLLTIVERIVYDFVIRDASNDRPSWGWVSANQGFKKFA